MFFPKRALLLPLAVVSFSVFLPSARAAVEVTEAADRVTIKIDGKLFTEYRFTGAPHVYFYPVLGPGGARMTRDWPMEDKPDEEHDHPHQRSLWYSHGKVNDIDFWGETISYKNSGDRKIGQIVHEKFLEVKGGEKEGVIASQNKWLAPDGTVVLRSVQTFRVYERPDNVRLFDFDVTLVAGEKEVTMQESKEGSIGMRLAESMRVTQPKDKPPGQGHMVSSAGDKDLQVWGKRAEWVDYYGPVEGKTVGVAIFDNPQNPRHPTRWHARDYGLFAANPFCEQPMDKTQPAGAGDYKIAPGQTVTFRYRIYMHEGDTEQGKVAAEYAAYAKDSAPAK